MIDAAEREVRGEGWVLTYESGMRQAYEGELIGELLYKVLSERARDQLVRAKLAAISEVERTTHEILAPVAARLHIVPRREQVDSTVARRAEELSKLSWQEFINKARTDWPPYIDKFKALWDLAPSTDRTVVQRLVEHEVALVEFLAAESQGEPTNDSLGILRRFIEHSQGTHPQAVAD